MAELKDVVSSEHDENVQSIDISDVGPNLKKLDTVDPEISYHVTSKTYLVLLVMGLAWSTCTLGNIGPSTTYTYCVTELGGKTKESWIPNAGLFPLIGLQPIWGSLADRFGKKWFIVAGGLFGIVGNVVAGTAKNIETVIGGQALNGIGSSLLLLVIPASMEIVTAETRAYAQGCTGLFNGVMAIVGLLTAGAFAKISISGWRWVYYFDAIFYGVSALLVMIVYNPPPTLLRCENSIDSQIRSVDYFGILLLLCGVVGIITSLTWGGNAYPWTSAQVLAMLILGGFLLMGFGLYEAYGRADGLIDHRFLESRNLLVILSVAFVDGMLLYGVNAFFPVEASAIFTGDPVKVNAYLLPLNILVLLGITASSMILGKTKHYRITLATSVFLIALFLGLLALVTPSRVAMTLVFTGFIGFGVGVTTVIPVVIMSYSVPPYIIGTAGTILASTRALGGTVGITIFSSIYANQMSKNLPTGVAKAVVTAGLPTASVSQFLGALLNSVGEVTAVPGVSPEIIGTAVIAIKNISAQSFRYVWITNMVIGLVTTFLCLFLQPVRDKMTVHIESALEDGKFRKKQLQHDF
ncbi:related to potential drug facilitator PEP5 [Phialocephala subalpina]|uniref:Related to potential drug facilitator PEP5 n=1 Tax=Phialocephala subalpina TaxID=576137 RepID=A0A1L7XX85_9HELO|nr:related to potential drug facilitator PEP5 [Phialocephala subalpina]